MNFSGKYWLECTVLHLGNLKDGREGNAVSLYSEFMNLF